MWCAMTHSYHYLRPILLQVIPYDKIDLPIRKNPIWIVMNNQFISGVPWLIHIIISAPHYSKSSHMTARRPIWRSPIRMRMNRISMWDTPWLIYIIVSVPYCSKSSHVMASSPRILLPIIALRDDFFAPVCCSVLQCDAECCSVLRCVTVKVTTSHRLARRFRCTCVFQCVAVWCSVLQCVAVCCT